MRGVRQGVCPPRLPSDERAGVRGYLTSGGTESLLQATRTARDWGRSERGIDRPNMVLATSAHAAFEKASHYFDVEARRVPVRDDFSADTDALADAVDDRHICILYLDEGFGMRIRQLAQ